MFLLLRLLEAVLFGVSGVLAVLAFTLTYLPREGVPAELIMFGCGALLVCASLGVGWIRRTHVGK